MGDIATWKWILAVVLVFAAAFLSGTETALTALGDARARQLIETGGRRARWLGIWVEQTERVLTILLTGATLVEVGAGALAGDIAIGIVRAHPDFKPGTTIAAATAITTVLILFFGEIIPKTYAKRHPVKVSLLSIPLVRLLYFVLWPLSVGVVKAASFVVDLFGGKSRPGPPVTGEEIEYLIEMGTREGVLDSVKEELLNSVLEFADRVVKEIMVPRTRITAIDKDAPSEEIVRTVTENPYSRMPVFEGSIDNVLGILLLRDIIPELHKGPGSPVLLQRYIKPAFFVPEQMKISKLLKEMQKRKTHLAIVVDEFGGTNGLATLEDVIEEIVGEIQDEGDVEATPVKAIGEGLYLAEAGIPLRDLEAYLNRQRDGAKSGADGRGQEVRFPEDGDYETLGGFLTASVGRVPQVGSLIAWDGLTFTVRAGDERRVARVEIARRSSVAVESESAGRAPAP